MKRPAISKKRPSYLAVDLGAESGRLILGELEEDQLQLCEVHRFPNLPVSLPGKGERTTLHWDVLRLWDEIQRGIQLASGQGELCSLGLDAWGVDFALLDRAGELVANPVHYRDSRTDGMLEEAFRRVGRERIFAQTGIQFMQINTLYQLLALASAGSPWLEAAETFLTIPDLFNYWLTGETACEFTNATTTQCYDPRRQDWARELLAALGIPGRLFPRVVPPGSVLGTHRHGSKPIPVVAPACHDTGSAVAAVPSESENFAWISSGTWSIMGVESPVPIIDAKSLAYNFTNEGGVGGTFRFSKNILGLWLAQECKRAWAQQGEDLSYDQIVHLAAQAEALVAVIDPNAADFLKPGDMPRRIQAYCQRTGQRVPQSKGELARCAMESIALKYRWVLERLEEMTGRRLDVVHVIGGGAQNRLLNQFTADATGRAVVAGPVEATSVGNILVQAVALGHLASHREARQVVRRTFHPQLFEPGEQGQWQEAYARLLGLMEQTSL